MATVSLMRLTIISAATSSAGRSGLIMRWPRLRDQISSRKATEKPSWLRTRMSHSSTRADEQARRLARQSSSSARDRSAGSPTSASAPAASRSAPRCAATTSGSRTSSAAPCPRCARAEAAMPSARAGDAPAMPLSWPLPPAIVRSPRRAMARNTSSRLARPKRAMSSPGRLVGDDAALLQHDDAVGQALDLGHVVGGEHDGGRAAPGSSPRACCAPSRRCRDRARRSARRAAAARAR